jgi:hypothetical protein
MGVLPVGLPPQVDPAMAQPPDWLERVAFAGKGHHQIAFLQLFDRYLAANSQDARAACVAVHRTLRVG